MRLAPLLFTLLLGLGTLRWRDGEEERDKKDYFADCQRLVDDRPQHPQCEPDQRGQGDSSALRRSGELFFNHLRVRLLLEVIMAKLKLELAKWQSDNPSDSVKLCPMCKSVE